MYSEIMHLNYVQWTALQDIYLRENLSTLNFPEAWEYNLSEIQGFRWTIPGDKSSSWDISIQNVMQDFEMRRNSKALIEVKMFSIPKASDLLLRCYQSVLLSYDCLGCSIDGPTEVKDHLPGCLSPIENVSEGELIRPKNHLKSERILRKYNNIRKILGLQCNLTLYNFDIRAYCEDHDYLTGPQPDILVQLFYC